jgi:membrane-associated phospholipid phosphatase
MQRFFYDWWGINKELFIKINQCTNIHKLPVILQKLSDLFFIANFSVGYIIICIIFYFKIKNSTDKENKFSIIYYELTRVGICYSLFGLTFAALKFSINLPRPFCSLPAAEFLTIANIDSERCLSSFPSAHTGLSIFVAYCLWPYVNNLLRFLLCFVILAVATSRLTLAMHYPADIFYSAIVATFVIVAGNYIHNFFYPRIIKPIRPLIFKLIFREN